jgi:hypothetical protein
MKTRRTTAAKEPQGKSVGTVMAEKARARANRCSDTEREKLLREGLAMIYGGCADAKIHADRR